MPTALSSRQRISDLSGEISYGESSISGGSSIEISYSDAESSGEIIVNASSSAQRTAPAGSNGRTPGVAGQQQGLHGKPPLPPGQARQGPGYLQQPAARPNRQATAAPPKQPVQRVSDADTLSISGSIGMSGSLDIEFSDSDEVQGAVSSRAQTRTSQPTHAAPPHGIPDRPGAPEPGARPQSTRPMHSSGANSITVTQAGRPKSARGRTSEAGSANTDVSSRPQSSRGPAGRGMGRNRQESDVDFDGSHSSEDISISYSDEDAPASVRPWNMATSAGGMQGTTQPPQPWNAARTKAGTGVTADKTKTAAGVGADRTASLQVEILSFQGKPKLTKITSAGGQQLVDTDVESFSVEMSELDDEDADISMDGSSARPSNSYAQLHASKASASAGAKQQGGVTTVSSRGANNSGNKLQAPARPPSHTPDTTPDISGTTEDSDAFPTAVAVRSTEDSGNDDARPSFSHNTSAGRVVSNGHVAEHHASSHSSDTTDSPPRLKLGNMEDLMAMLADDSTPVEHTGQATAARQASISPANSRAPARSTVQHASSTPSISSVASSSPRSHPHDQKRDGSDWNAASGSISDAGSTADSGKRRKAGGAQSSKASSTASSDYRPKVMNMAELEAASLSSGAHSLYSSHESSKSGSRQRAGRNQPSSQTPSVSSSALSTGRPKVLPIDALEVACSASGASSSSGRPRLMTIDALEAASSVSDASSSSFGRPKLMTMDQLEAASSGGHDSAVDDGETVSGSLRDNSSSERVSSSSNSDGRPHVMTMAELPSAAQIEAAWEKAASRHSLRSRSSMATSTDGVDDLLAGLTVVREGGYSSSSISSSNPSRIQEANLHLWPIQEIDTPINASSPGNLTPHSHSSHEGADYTSHTPMHKATPKSQPSPSPLSKALQPQALQRHTSHAHAAAHSYSSDDFAPSSHTMSSEEVSPTPVLGMGVAPSWSTGAPTHPQGQQAAKSQACHAAINSKGASAHVTEEWARPCHVTPAYSFERNGAGHEPGGQQVTGGMNATTPAMVFGKVPQLATVYGAESTAAETVIDLTPLGAARRPTTTRTVSLQVGSMNEVATQVAYDSVHHMLVEGATQGPLMYPPCLTCPTPSAATVPTHTYTAAAVPPQLLPQPMLGWPSSAQLQGSHACMARHSAGAHVGSVQSAPEVHGGFRPGSGSAATALHSALGQHQHQYQADACSALPSFRDPTTSLLGGGWGVLSTAVQNLKAAAMLEQVEAASTQLRGLVELAALAASKEPLSDAAQPSGMTPRRDRTSSAVTFADTPAVPVSAVQAEPKLLTIPALKCVGGAGAGNERAVANHDPAPVNGNRTAAAAMPAAEQGMHASGLSSELSTQVASSSDGAHTVSDETERYTESFEDSTNGTEEDCGAGKSSHAVIRSPFTQSAHQRTHDGKHSLSHSMIGETNTGSVLGLSGGTHAAENQVATTATTNRASFSQRPSMVGNTDGYTGSHSINKRASHFGDGSSSHLSHTNPGTSCTLLHKRASVAGERLIPEHNHMDLLPRPSTAAASAKAGASLSPRPHTAPQAAGCKAGPHHDAVQQQAGAEPHPAAAWQDKEEGGRQRVRDVSTMASADQAVQRQQAATARDTLLRYHALLSSGALPGGLLDPASLARMRTELLAGAAAAAATSGITHVDVVQASHDQASVRSHLGRLRSQLSNLYTVTAGTRPHASYSGNGGVVPHAPHATAASDGRQVVLDRERHRLIDVGSAGTAAQYHTASPAVPQFQYTTLEETMQYIRLYRPATTAAGSQ